MALMKGLLLGSALLAALAACQRGEDLRSEEASGLTISERWRQAHAAQARGQLALARLTFRELARDKAHFAVEPLLYLAVDPEAPRLLDEEMTGMMVEAADHGNRLSGLLLYRASKLSFHKVSEAEKSGYAAKALFWAGVLQRLDSPRKSDEIRLFRTAVDDTTQQDIERAVAAYRPRFGCYAGANQAVIPAALELRWAHLSKPALAAVEVAPDGQKAEFSFTHPESSSACTGSITNGEKVYNNSEQFLSFSGLTYQCDQGESGEATLPSLLAGEFMQGNGWDHHANRFNVTAEYELQTCTGQ